jgi:hypothetical protein
MGGRLRKEAIFLTDIPDDHVEDEDGEIVVWGGKGVAEALREMFERLGYETGEPKHEPEHGWEFQIHRDKRTLWFLVTDGVDEYYLHSGDITLSPFGLFRPGRRRRFHAEALHGLNAELRKDPRFRDIRWFEDLDTAPDGAAADPGGLD